MLGWLWLLLAAVAAAPPDAGVPDADASAVAGPGSPGFDLRWSRVDKPAPGPPAVWGQPGAGCIRGARALPLRGPSFVVAHPERHRNFGHPTLIAFVRKLAAQVREENLPPLFVGDLGQPRGGPTPTGHRSHQSGLDVDLWYLPPPRRFTPGEGSTPSAPSVAELRTKRMLPAWSRRVARLLEIVGGLPEVDRVFVHPSVKRALCRDEARRGPWLRLLRPWWGHQDHFHVRLRCPADSPDCVPGSPLPAGEGCGAALDWWFSENAAQTAAQRPPLGQGAPPMPAACEELLPAQIR